MKALGKQSIAKKQQSTINDSEEHDSKIK